MDENIVKRENVMALLKIVDLVILTEKASKKKKAQQYENLHRECNN